MERSGAKKSDEQSGAVSGLNLPLMAAKACCPLSPYSFYSALFRGEGWPSRLDFGGNPMIFF